MHNHIKYNTPIKLHKTPRQSYVPFSKYTLDNPGSGSSGGVRANATTGQMQVSSAIATNESWDSTATRRQIPRNKLALTACRA